MTFATDHTAPSSAASYAPRAAPAKRDGLGRLAQGLTWLAAALALATSLAGLVIDGVYTGPVSTAEMLRGYDLVTAVVVVPSLAVAAVLVRRGSMLGRRATASLVACLLYTYAYYLFG